MQSNRLGWILLTPTLVILVLFGVVPFFYVLWLAFHQWNPFAADPHVIYNGADNFRRPRLRYRNFCPPGRDRRVRLLRGGQRSDHRLFPRAGAS